MEYTHQESEELDVFNSYKVIDKSKRMIKHCNNSTLFVTNSQLELFNSVNCSVTLLHSTLILGQTNTSSTIDLNTLTMTDSNIICNNSTENGVLHIKQFNQYGNIDDEIEYQFGDSYTIHIDSIDVHSIKRLSIETYSTTFANRPINLNDEYTLNMKYNRLDVFKGRFNRKHIIKCISHCHNDLFVYGSLNQNNNLCMLDLKDVEYEYHLTCTPQHQLLKSTKLNLDTLFIEHVHLPFIDGNYKMITIKGK